MNNIMHPCLSSNKEKEVEREEKTVVFLLDIKPDRKHLDTTLLTMVVTLAVVVMKMMLTLLAAFRVAQERITNMCISKNRIPLTKLVPQTRKNHRCPLVI